MPAAGRTTVGRIAVQLAAACVLGLLVWLTFGRTAFVNYDSAWSLNWMRELAGGQRPDLDRLFSPTPHPLSDLFSLLLAPLSGAGGFSGAAGTGAETALIVSALFWLGALGVITYRLGREWFGVAAGVIAAVLILTREPVLSYGLRTYLDLPYAVFLLLALLAETRRPRNGRRTVAWITLAGLLRPEAWLLAAAYVGYLAVVQIRAGTQDRDGTQADMGTDADAARGGTQTSAGGDPNTGPERPTGRGRIAVWAGRVAWPELAVLTGIALLAPLGWIVEGLVLAGDPLQALTGTQQNAADLDRVTGIGSAVTVMPRRLGEIVREPVLLAAFGGVVLSLVLLRRRALLGVAAGAAAGVAFFALAAAGLPLLTRYLVFPATLLVVFAAAGLVGWLRLPPGHPWRRRWQAFAAIALVAFLAFAPSQAHRLDRLQHALALQQRVIGDLRTVVGDDVRPALRTGACGPGDSPGTRPGRDAQPDVALPNHRAVPQVLLWLGTDVAGRSPNVGPLTPGAHPAVTLLPASEEVARGFILDKADRGAGLPAPPSGSIAVGTHGSWTVFAANPRCAANLRGR